MTDRWVEELARQVYGTAATEQEIRFGRLIAREIKQRADEPGKSERVTPMLLANAAFCIENWDDVAPAKRGRVIDELLAASEALSPEAAAPVALGEGFVSVPDVMKIFQLMVVSRVMTPNTSEGWLAALQIYAVSAPAVPAQRSRTTS